MCMKVFVECPLEVINNLLLVSAAKVMHSPVQQTMKSFLNPYSIQFIVVFNNVQLVASWQFCPHCIYFLSDARPNNSVIPCGPTTQTAETPISLTPGGSDSLFPLLSHPTISSFSHCSTNAPLSHLMLHLLRPHPLLSVDFHIWERLRAKKWCKNSILILFHKIQEDLLIFKI